LAGCSCEVGTSGRARVAMRCRQERRRHAFVGQRSMRQMPAEGSGGARSRSISQAEWKFTARENRKIPVEGGRLGSLHSPGLSRVLGSPVILRGNSEEKRRCGNCGSTADDRSRAGLVPILASNRVVESRDRQKALCGNRLHEGHGACQVVLMVIKHDLTGSAGNSRPGLKKLEDPEIPKWAGGGTRAHGRAAVCAHGTKLAGISGGARPTKGSLRSAA
jgi:hypothetical protein